MPAPEVATSPSRVPSWTVALPFAVLVVALAVSALAADWRPVHDFAFFELRVRDLGGADTPLLGPYSRYGWSHPGPMLFAVLAVPYHLLLGASEGLLLGAVLVNGVSLAGALLVAHRRGGAPLVAWTAVVLALLVHALGGETLISPWNPHVTILPLVLFLLLAWSVAVGDVVALPFLAAVATFLVQSHVQYGAVALATVGWAVAVHLLARHRAGRSSDGVGDRGDAARRRRWWLATAAVVVVLWVPPLLDQVAGSGNLGELVRFFLTSDEPGAGLRASLGAAAGELSPAGSWSTGDIPLQLFTGQVDPDPWWTLAVPAVALLAAAGVTLRRRDWQTLHLLAVAAVSSLAAVVSVARLVGPLWNYLVVWLGGVAAVLWLAVGWSLLQPVFEWARRRWPSPSLRPVALALVGVLVAALVLTTPDLLGADPPERERGELVDQLAADVLPALADEGAPVLVRPFDTAAGAFPAPSSRQLAAGLALALERDGTAVRVLDGDWELAPGSGGARMFDDHRAEAGPVSGTLTVVSGRALDEYQPPEGAVEVARVEDEAARARQAELEAELAATFRSLGFPDEADAVPTDALNQVVWTVPELARFASEITDILELRETPRAAAWWEPAP